MPFISCQTTGHLPPLFQKAMPKQTVTTIIYGPPVESYKGLSGQPETWQFRRTWTLKPVANPGGGETLLAGVEDAALFQSLDDGATWTEFSALRHHPSHSDWEPGAAGCCLHTV